MRGRQLLTANTAPATTPPAANEDTEKFFARGNPAANPPVPGDIIPADLLNSLLQAIDHAAAQGKLTDSGLDLDAIAKSATPNAWLWRIMRAAVQSTAASPVTELKNLNDTPAAAVFNSSSNIGKLLAVASGGQINLVDAANVFRKATTAPTTSTANTAGDLMVFGGHSFIWRGQTTGAGSVDDGAGSGTRQVWDVSGVHAIGTLSQGGNLLSNGIQSPANYAGDGWARFRSVERQGPGTYRFTMRSAVTYNTQVTFRWPARIPFPVRSDDDYYFYTTDITPTGFTVVTADDNNNAPTGNAADAGFDIKVTAQ